MARLAKDFTVSLNKDFAKLNPGSIVTRYNRKDAKGNFALETVQFDFGQEERQFQREKVISDVSEIADILNSRLNPSRAD